MGFPLPSNGGIPYMVPTKPSPRIALARWLAQIHYNAIRNIETVWPYVTQSGTKKPLRGFKIADDLVITRKRVFYRVVGLTATPLSLADVAANYNLEMMQTTYREATDAWKNAQRNLRRRRA